MCCGQRSVLWDHLTSGDNIVKALAVYGKYRKIENTKHNHYEDAVSCKQYVREPFLPEEYQYLEAIYDHRAVNNALRKQFRSLR